MIESNYYAIIPATVRYDKDLTANAKLLFAEITSLTHKTGYCYATNEYFEELYGVSTSTIKNWLSQLEKKGYINREIVYKEGTKEIQERHIRIFDLPQPDFRPTPRPEIWPENNKEYNNKKEIYKESFEEWWSFFPKLRAGSKSEAYKKYVQVITKEHITPQDLLQRVKIYAASDEVKRGYASGAVRYFNDCKYNNIYGSAVKNTNSIPADIDLYDGKYFDFNLNRVVATKEDNPDWSKYNRATGEFDL